jgi:hypothetical protein
MFGIGRKIKKKYLIIIIKFLKKIISKNIYSLILFLSAYKKFKKEINKNKTKNLYSSNLDKINYYEFKITSQNNEDGIIDYIFTKVPSKKFFIEIGFDFFECNSLNLIKNGWNGVLIEADEEKCIKAEKCIRHFYPKSKVKVINTKIDKDNINDFVNYEKIDFFSIDIDGNDYWVLEKLKTKNINIICSEYNPWIGNKTFKTIPYNKNFLYMNDYYFGASLNAYVEMLDKKEFSLIAVDSSGTNAFYANNALSNKFEILVPEKSYKEATKFHSKSEQLEIKDYIKKKEFINLK